MDGRAVPFCRRGQAPGEAAHVHLAAALVEQAAVEALALHLGTHAGGIEDLHIAVHAIGDETVGTALQGVHLIGFGGHLELAVAQEIAGDLFLLHQPCHRVDRVVIGVIPGAGTLHADLGGDLGIVHREAVVDVAAVAARGFRRHMGAGFQHHHRGPALGESQCRRQAGKAAADDGHVNLRGQLARGGDEQRCRIGPVGFQLHGRGFRQVNGER